MDFDLPIDGYNGIGTTVAKRRFFFVSTLRRQSGHMLMRLNNSDSVLMLVLISGYTTRFHAFNLSLVKLI